MKSSQIMKKHACNQKYKNINQYHIFRQLENVALICGQNFIRSSSVLMAFMFNNGYTNKQIKQRFQQSDATDQAIEIMFQKIKPYQDKLSTGSTLLIGYAQDSNMQQTTSQLQTNQNQLDQQSNIIIQEINDDDSINAQSEQFQPPKVGYRQFNQFNGTSKFTNSQYEPPSSNLNPNNKTKILETDKFAESRPISQFPNPFQTPTAMPPESKVMRLEDFESKTDDVLDKSKLPINSKIQVYQLPDPLTFKTFKIGNGFKCVNWPKEQY